MTQWFVTDKAYRNNPDPRGKGAQASILTPSTLAWKFPGCGTHTQGCILSELRRWTWKSTDQMAHLHQKRQCTRENCTGGELWRSTQGPPWVFRGMLASSCMWGNYPRPGKKHREREASTLTQNQNSAHSPSQTGKARIPRVLGRDPEGALLYSGDYHSKLKF